MHMNLELEKAKLMSTIRIPVSDIKFFGGYCEVYYKKAKIGVLPTFDVKGILHYDTNKESLFKLNWSTIYLDNKDTLADKIKDSLKLENVNVTIGTFRRVYVRDSENNVVASFECIFEKDTWRVNKEQ
jgi:hypothetical protein